MLSHICLKPGGILPRSITATHGSATLLPWCHAQKWIGFGLINRIVRGESRVATVRYRAQLRQFLRARSTGEIPRLRFGQDCVTGSIMPADFDWAQLMARTKECACAYFNLKRCKDFAENWRIGLYVAPGISGSAGFVGVRLSWRRRMRCFPIPPCTCSGSCS